MNVESLKYSKEHLWVEVGKDTAKIGITDYAQNELGDVVFVELPEVGKKVKKGDVVGSIESVKSVSEIYAPISGKISKVNKSLEETPETINESPYGEGWLVEIEFKDKTEIDKLLDANSYKNLI